MDPASAIGLAGAVVGIVDVISRIVTSLQTARERWETADLTITLLIAQLATLKAALNQVATWISSRLAGAPQHHQLIIDLDLSIGSCNDLISLMDRRIAELDWNEARDLSFRSKLMLVLQDKATKDCQDHLNNQVNALNLLLTIFNCRTQSEQIHLLESAQSREVFQQVRDDSSSLLVLRDSDSLLSRSTRTTENSSKLSLRFMFDGELLQSKIYQGTIRFLLRRAIHGERDLAATTEQSSDYISPEERKRVKKGSRNIDNVLERYRVASRDESQIVVHGLHQSGKSTLCRMVRSAEYKEDINYRNSRISTLPLQDPSQVINETMVRYGGVVWSFIEQTGYYNANLDLRENFASTPRKKPDMFEFLGINPSGLIFVVDVSSVDPNLGPVASGKEMQESILLFEFTWRRWSQAFLLWPVVVFHKMDVLLGKLGPDFPNVRGAANQIFRDLLDPFLGIAGNVNVCWTCHNSPDGENICTSRMGVDSAGRQILNSLHEALIQKNLDNLIFEEGLS